VNQCGYIRVTHGTNHVTTKQCCKYTTSVDIRNTPRKASHSFRIPCSKSAVSLLESGERHYIKATNNNADLFLHFQLHASQFCVLLLPESLQLLLVIGLQLLPPLLQHLVQLQQRNTTPAALKLHPCNDSVCSLHTHLIVCSLHCFIASVSTDFSITHVAICTYVLSLSLKRKKSIQQSLCFNHRCCPSAFSVAFRFSLSISLSRPSMACQH